MTYDYNAIADLIKDGKVGQYFRTTPDTTVIIERIGEGTIEASVTSFTPSGFISEERLVSFPLK